MTQMALLGFQNQPAALLLKQVSWKDEPVERQRTKLDTRPFHKFAIPVKPDVLNIGYSVLELGHAFIRL